MFSSCNLRCTLTKDYEVDWDEENPDQPDDTPVISGGPGRGYLTEEDVPSFEFFVEE